jgi:predicted membrane protein
MLKKFFNKITETVWGKTLFLLGCAVLFLFLFFKLAFIAIPILLLSIVIFMFYGIATLWQDEQNRQKRWKQEKNEWNNFIKNSKYKR